MELNKRQSLILDFINKRGSSKSSEIEEYIFDVLDNVSRITIIRDINLLLKNKFYLCTRRA